MKTGLNLLNCHPAGSLLQLGKLRQLSFANKFKDKDRKRETDAVQKALERCLLLFGGYSTKESPSVVEVKSV